MTPVLEPRLPRFSDAVVYNQNRYGDDRIPRMIGSVQPTAVPVHQRLKNDSVTGWSREMRMHCCMFTVITVLLIMLLLSISVFIYLLFSGDGTFTKIKRLTDTGDFMVQRLNDSGIVESVFDLAVTWQNGNYTDNAALALDRAGDNIGRIMNTLDTMDWNSFKLAANATLYEVQAIIDILEAFISGGSFQISIPIPVRPP